MVDPSAFKERLRNYTEHRSMKVRMSAGRVLVAAGDVDLGCKVLAPILERGSEKELYNHDLADVLKVLLKEGSDQSRQTARIIFKNPFFYETPWGVRPAIANHFAEAGLADGYVTYLSLLDQGGLNTVNEIVYRLAPMDPEIIRINETIRGSEQIPAVRDWLKAKIKALKAPPR